MAASGTNFMLIVSALTASRGRQCSPFPEQFVAVATSGYWDREPLVWANTIGRKRLWLLESALIRGGN